MTSPLQRVANTTLQMPPTLPLFGYAATNAFGAITFPNPTAVAVPPGETNRLFIVEQRGIVSVITNLASPNRTLFLNITNKVLGGVPNDERGLLGLAFHPGYATNGYFFVFYVGNAITVGGTNHMHDLLSRFQVSSTNANFSLPDSEVPLLMQFDEANNHNAGALNFGPEGYLYVSLGDEGGGNDQYNNSQRIDKDFFSGILRLDVDKRAGSLPPNPHISSTTNYAVPADNPFVGATSFNNLPVNPANVRTEFWAVGLRNPWRFSFDPLTGRLYCADVGQDAWEEIDIIVRGGNYGWAYREGLNPGPKAPPPNFSSINPIQVYGHGSSTNQGNSVTGGVVYRGTRLSQLTGGYVFSDYVSGNVWVLRYDGTNTVPFQRLFGETGIAGFGVDPRNGDVLLVNQTLDTIRRLIYSTNITGAPLPQTLANTGVFTNLLTLEPQPGVVPYTVNVAGWTDHGIATRWFSIPATNQFITFHRETNWSFPTGTVWIQHFDLELTNGSAASRRRVETRLLVKNQPGAYGVSYRWSTSTTNANLVPEEGMEDTFTIDEGGGLLRTQLWHYPSRQECLGCHTITGGTALGFNTAQLNRQSDYSGASTNQISALSEAGYFSTNVTGIHTLRSLAALDHAAASLEFRARSYLAANCSECHQPGGASLGFWDSRFTTPTAASGIINGPLINNGADTNNRVIKPGFPANSMILTRLSLTGPGRMPPLGATSPDGEAIALFTSWITNDLPAYETFADWQVSRFGSPSDPNAAPLADPDADGALNSLEYLTGTDPKSRSNFWSISVEATGGVARVSFPQIANRGFEVQAAPILGPPAAWVPLDLTGNEPFFSISNKAGVISDPLGPTNTFYRVRVFAP
jgi:glucose/arabinose dehydrogenase